MPNLQRGGHASILLTFLCNFAILATQRGGPWPNAPPPNTPLMAIIRHRKVYRTLFFQKLSYRFTQKICIQYRITEFEKIYKSAIFAIVGIHIYLVWKACEKRCATV